jgi:carboxylesterase type B
MNQVGSRDGVKTFGYLLTDRNAVESQKLPQSAPGSLGGATFALSSRTYRLLMHPVTHGTDLAFLYGHLYGAVSPALDTFITQMIDYWVSFATSLTPNDGRGSQREITG